jgi:O-antigen/teichoic acid export membrane protein
VIVVAVTPLLTRLYTPDDMGVFGVFASFVAVASVAVCWRLDLGVATAASRNEAAGLAVLCLLVALPTSLILGAGLAGLIEARWLSFDLLSMWSVPLAAVALTATGVFSALRYWHVGQFEFNTVGSALVRQGAGRAGASVAFGLLGTGWAGLLLGDLAGRLVGIRRLWVDAYPALRAEIQSFGGAGLLGRLRQARRYPLIVLPSSLLDAAAAALPIPVIATLFGPAAAGQFALVWRVGSIPSGLVASAVADVFHAHAAAAQREEPARVRSLMWGTCKRLALVATLVFVPLCGLAPLVFGWVFGERWETAGWLLLLLLPMWWSATVISPLSRVLIVSGRLVLKLVFDISYLVLPIGTLLAFRGQSLEVAVFAYGIAATVAYAIYAAVLLTVVRARDRSE